MTRPALFLLLLGAILRPATAQQMQLPRVDYRDRVEAVWTAQIVAVLLAWPHEHQVASALGLTNFPKRYTTAQVDDDWYYEMCAVRGFEKYGVGMTVKQLGPAMAGKSLWLVGFERAGAVKPRTQPQSARLRPPALQQTLVHDRSAVQR